MKTSTNKQKPPTKQNNKKRNKQRDKQTMKFHKSYYTNRSFAS